MSATSTVRVHGEFGLKNVGYGSKLKKRLERCLKGSVDEFWQQDDAVVRVSLDIDPEKADPLGELFWETSNAWAWGGVWMDFPSGRQQFYSQGGDSEHVCTGRPEGLDSRLGGTGMLNDPYVGSVAFSPDGATVATLAVANWAAVVRLWDVGSGSLRRVLRMRGNRESGFSPDRGALAFSSDGDWLATSQDKSAYVWATGSGRLCKHLTMPDDVVSLAFVEGAAPQERKLVVLTHKHLRFYHAGTYELERTVEPPQSDAAWVAIGAGGNRALLRRRAGSVVLWDLTQGKALKTFKGKTRDPEVLLDGCVTWSVENRKKSVRQVHVQGENAKTWSLLLESPCEERYPGKVAATADGRFLLEGVPGCLKIWSLEDGQVVTEVPMRHAKEAALGVGAGGAVAVGIGEHLWLTSLEALLAGEVPGTSWFIEDAVVSPDGECALLFEPENPRASLIDTRTGAVRFEIDGGKDGFSLGYGSSAAFGAAGDVIVLSQGRKLRVVEVEAGQVLHEDKLARNINALVVTANGEHMLAKSDDGWRVHPVGSKAGKKIGLESDANALAVPRGQGLVAAFEDASAWLWDVAQRKCLCTVQADGEDESIEAATALADGSVFVWSSLERVVASDVASGQVLWSAAVPGNVLEVSPDQKVLWVASYGRIEALDVASGARLRAALPGHQTYAEALRLTADGGLLSVGTEGLIERWSPEHIGGQAWTTSAKAWSPAPVAKKATKARQKAPKASPDDTTEGPLWSLDGFGPGDPGVSQSPQEAAVAAQTSVHDLEVRGTLTFNSTLLMENGFKALDNDAYTEFYSSKDFKVDGKAATIDLATDLPADCTSVLDGFRALTKKAAKGHIDVRLGRSISFTRITARWGEEVLCPPLPPGALRRVSYDYKDHAVNMAALHGDVLAIFDRSAPGGVEVLDLASGQIVASGEMGWYEHKTPHLSFSPDGRFLAVPGNKRLEVLDLSTGQWTITRKKNKLESCLFLSDGRLLTGHNGQMKVWTDGPQWRCEQTIDVPGKAIRKIVEATGEPGHVAYISTDHTVRVIKLDGVEVVAQVPCHRDHSQRLAASASGAVVACNKTHVFLRLAGGSISNLSDKTYWARAWTMASVPLAGEGKRTIAAVGNMRFIFLYDVDTGERLGVLEGHKGSIIDALEFTRDGRKLISVGENDVLIWDMAAVEAMGWGHPEDPHVVSLPA